MMKTSLNIVFLTGSCVQILFDLFRLHFSKLCAWKIARKKINKFVITGDKCFAVLNNFSTHARVEAIIVKISR